MRAPSDPLAAALTVARGWGPLGLLYTSFVPFFGPGLSNPPLCGPTRMGSFRVWPGGSLTGLATYWPAWAPAYVGSRWQGDGSARLGSESLLTGLCLLSAPRLGSSPVAAGWSDWPQSDLAERWARIPVRHNAPATRAFARARSPGRPLLSARHRPGRPGAGRVVPSGWSRLCGDCGLARSGG